MMRRVFWLLALIAVAGGVSAIVDRREAARRRQLWAEATDPN